MSDIVKRLRSNKVLLVGDMKAGNSTRSAMLDAADEIERLRAELEWYGEQARLARLVHSGGDEGRHALAADGGNRARAAITTSKIGQ